MAGILHPGVGVDRGGWQGGVRAPFPDRFSDPFREPMGTGSREGPEETLEAGAS
jgi:hypothetical protein